MAENTSDKAKPFSREYVLRTTARHMMKAVDTSIAKTMARVPEFEGDSEKAQEILIALSDLHAMKRQISAHI
jgi:hypothetical protein